jgi:hypothetical protein
VGGDGGREVGGGGGEDVGAVRGKGKGKGGKRGDGERRSGQVWATDEESERAREKKRGREDERHGNDTSMVLGLSSLVKV